MTKPTIKPERNHDAWDALSKVYNMPDVPDEAKSIIGDVMLNLEEPERETGKWIVVHPTKESTEYVACDQCGQVESWDENVGMLCALVGERYAHFCPNCGARMKVDDEKIN